MTIVEAIFNVYNGIVIIFGGIIAYFLCKEYQKTHSRPLLTSIPGVFTSLGLLGTFLSIVLALGNINESDFSNVKAEPEEEMTVTQGRNAEEEIDMENGAKELGTNPSNGTDNTIEIIHKLVPAFTSSIFGLLLALCATVVCKVIFAREDGKLDKKIDGKTPEECMYDIMKHTSDAAQILRTHENESKQYNELLKSNIEEQNKILQTFIDDFAKKMNAIFDNMKESIATQVDSIGKEQLSKAGTVLENISERLGEVTTQLLDAQKDSVKNLVERTNEQLESMAKSIASQYELIQNNANENVTTMTALKEQFAQANANMLQQATDMNKQSSDNMRDSLKGFVDNISESVRNECTSLHSAIESNVESLTKSYDFLKERLAQITHDYEQAGLAFDNAVTNSHRQNESTEKAINKANESLAQLEETNERMGELLDAFNSRQDNVETLISHINEMGSAIATLQKLETQLKRLNK